MWNRIAEFFQDNAPFGVLVAIAGLFGLGKRMRDIELTFAKHMGNYDRMEKQVDWMFTKMGGNGNDLKGE